MAIRRTGTGSAVAETQLTIDPSTQDILDSPQAGARVIRGTAARTAGHFVGLALLVLAAPLLTRHLGVADYGSYVVVGSLIAIALLVADAGLTVAAVREYSVRDGSARERLVQNLVATRLVTSLIAGAGVIAFALVAGYEPVVVAGTALGAVGLVLAVAQQTYVIPLAAALRLELVTALGVLRQALTVAGILVLVALGSGLLAFFVLPIPVGIVALVTTLFAVRRYGRFRPAVERDELRHLLGEMPAAIASTAGALFYRVAIVVMAILATAEQTGYFGLSLQVVDVFVAVAALIGGSALPVLARAAEKDRQRLAFAFQQLFDMSVVLGIGAAFVLVVGAEPVIAFLGGPDFEPAVPVLRIQGFAVALTFLVLLFGYVLWAVRGNRQLVVGNLVGISCAVVLTAALVPAGAAEGAALAMLIAECILVSWLGVALFRLAPDIRPSLRTLAKALAAVAAAAGIVLTPFAPLIEVVVGTILYVAILLALRAIPVEIWRATFGSRST